MKGRRGAVTLEFTLVGIPLLFTLISTVEMSRGMWMYQTQAYAISQGVRYLVVHGADCSSSGNSCTTTIGSIAGVIANGGVGLAPAQWNVTLISASGENNISCNPLSTCLSNSTVWPPSPDNALGSNVAISATYPFSSAMFMFFPGTTPVSFGTYNLGAYSKQEIMF
ncbi:MAG: TadE/TadG family type IV pilus assembly protein [Bryobacteraceae bacterium]